MKQESSETMTPLDALLYHTWLPKLRQAVNNDWNPYEPDALVELLGKYKSLIKRKLA